MPFIPNTYGNATFVFRAAGAARDSTFQIGIRDTNSTPLAPSTIPGQLATAWATAGRPFVAGNMSADWSFLGIDYTYQDPSGPILYSLRSTITGTLLTSCPPSNCAVLVNKSTSLGGRHNRGRMFVPPCNFNEANIDGRGNINASDVAAKQVWYTAAYTGMLAVNLVPQLFHATSSPPTTAINGFALQGQLATQRRRMRR